MENALGWKVLIEVPQPNGRVVHHLWVAAIPDDAEVRARLWLSQIPCEAQFEPLSAQDLIQLGLEPREVRRVLLPATQSTTMVSQIEDPESRPEEHAASTTRSDQSNATITLEQGTDTSPEGNSTSAASSSETRFLGDLQDGADPG